MKPTTYLPQLTGYRAVAALIVFVAHAAHRGFLPEKFGEELIGEISYSFYLFHVPILDFMKDAFSNSPLVLISSLIITVLLASLSFYFFEEPLNKAIKTNCIKL